MPKRRIQYVEFKLARPRWDALRAATRKLRRVLGEEAPTLEQLVAYQFGRRDARLVANEYQAANQATPSRTYPSVSCACSIPSATRSR